MNLPTTTFSFILHFVRQQRFKFAAMIGISTLWALNDSLFPYFLKRIVNTLQSYKGEPEGIYAAVGGILTLLVIFWIVTEFFQRTQGIIQIYTFPKFRASIRRAVFEYVQSHSHEYFSNHFAGNIAKRLADLPGSCQNILEIICLQFVAAGAYAIFVLTMMWMTKPFLAVIIFCWLCIHLSLTFLFLRYSNDLWSVHADAESALSGKIVDAFSNSLNMRLFARSSYESQYLEKYQNDEIAKSKKAMWLVEIMRVFQGINGLGLIFGVVFTLVYGWAHHWITLGDFTQVGMQTLWLLGWIWHVSFQMTIFARETGVIDNALSLIRQGHGLVDQENAYSIRITKGNIRLDNVSFAYQKNQPVFQNLNLEIPAGKKIGLVGFSGSGKSTFVNLILRFYDVQQGRILIDDQDIAEVTQESLRSQIAMIPQDPALFHRSLMENIRYGRLEASEEEVIQASKLAHCHEFIEKLDGGYDALVGERGVKLSGGQRQRIAIARAILKQAPILILDEATSALDSVTEKMIQESLQHLMHGRTTICIAHRLSTLANMDEILVFDQGKIIESGTKESLLAIKGHFARLWNMQTDGFLPEDKANSIDEV